LQGQPYIHTFTPTNTNVNPHFLQQKFIFTRHLHQTKLQCISIMEKSLVGVIPKTSAIISIIKDHIVTKKGMENGYEWSGQSTNSIYQQFIIEQQETTRIIGQHN